MPSFFLLFFFFFAADRCLHVYDGVLTDPGVVVLGQDGQRPRQRRRLHGIPSSFFCLLFLLLFPPPSPSPSPPPPPPPSFSMVDWCASNVHASLPHAIQLMLTPLNSSFFQITTIIFYMVSGPPWWSPLWVVCSKPQGGPAGGTVLVCHECYVTRFHCRLSTKPHVLTLLTPTPRSNHPSIKSKQMVAMYTTPFVVCARDCCTSFASGRTDLPI